MVQIHGLHVSELNGEPSLGRHVGTGPVHTSFEQGSALQQHLDSLRSSIDSMNAAWGKSREVMERTYGKAHVLKQQLDSTWQAGQSALDAACRRLRDNLDKAGEDRILCEEAQSSVTEGLPALFLKRFKDPMRFANFQGGVIHGCQPSKFGAPSDECNCPSGHEELGCQDSADSSSFELKCSNLLNTQIPTSGAVDFFKSGGACHITQEDEIVKQVVDDDMLKHLETSAMPVGFFALPCYVATSEQCFQRNGLSRRHFRKQAAHNFIWVASRHQTDQPLDCD
ncbi:GIP [Symbiodinium natans]|uniref:GIP protein n=1 Tax=Symbiodinium natans TaxID=878477 RepID=A0A812SFK9_9DINO|nr:GIP [Symbiodinium natans]